VSNAGKLALAIAGLAAAVILFVVLRPGDETSAPTITSETGSGPAETTPVTMPTSVTTTLEPEPERPDPVQITFQGGEVTGPRRPQFTVGARVVLIVRADVADHVHIHGYDLMADVAPGAPARIAFEADAEGRYEVELEDRHLPLTQLVVNP
jgi:hypothetical protein